MEKLRNKLNEIDDQIVKLYAERMETVKEIGQFKEKAHLPITSKSREDEVVKRLEKEVPEEISVFVKMLYQTIFQTSKAYQSKFTAMDTSLTKMLKETLLEGFKKFPSSASVACQGVEGAYSSIAANRLFSNPNITFFKNFEGVCTAVEKGLCRYGILPIDNSLNGSVGEVYDLLLSKKFYIVRSVRLPIRQSLLGKGSLSDVKTVYSHPQAIGQCSNYLNKAGYAVHETENTAVSAKMVSDSDDRTIAAICSAECASLYDLKVLDSNIQNDDTNFTRFICISKALELYEDSNRISIIIGLPHRSGSLQNVLARFSAMNLNLTKLSSRPVLGTEFEYIFYLDFESNVKYGEALSLLSELERECESFAFLGSYFES